MSTTFTGIPASPGTVVGPIHLHAAVQHDFRRDQPDGPGPERDRLKLAVDDLRHRLEGRVDEVGDTASEIFAAHLMFLDDSAFQDPILAHIDTGGLSAEAAVERAGNDVAAEFEAIDDDYLAARAADIRDLRDQLISVLVGSDTDDLAQITEPSIIVAHDLTPSQTVSIPAGMALGFCTEVGSAVSHAAILARSMGVPAVVGLGSISVVSGQVAIVDGDEGIVIVDPGETEVKQARDAQAAIAERRRLAMEDAHFPAETLDGHLVEVVANVGSVDDAARAVAAGAEGIGLLRTEFLFLDRTDLPGEDEQTAVYKAIHDQFPTSPVVVRTLDVGGDKELPAIQIAPELNPFLGVRGLRLTLARPDIFHTQLRAILRGAAGRDAKIMFPMVASATEITAARAALDAAAASLDDEGLDRAREIEVGVMIEVPSAAVMADRLAGMVDFFSIGTNDLTQYTLAVDRTNEAVATLADALHPAVTRLIRTVVEAAHAEGKWVGVCGELAGDPLAAGLLIGLGVDELSMSPPAVPLVKEKIRSISREQSRSCARACLDATTPDEVRAILQAEVTNAD